MINVNNLSNQVKYDNIIAVCGQVRYALTDEDASKIVSILNGMVNAYGHEPTVIKSAEDVSTLHTDEKKTPFPAYPGRIQVGRLSFYDCILGVRTWEWKGTKPEKWTGSEKEWRDRVMSELKDRVKAAGGEWNEDKKAFVFTDKKAFNKFQKAEEKAIQDYKAAKQAQA